jgi:NADPH-dependent 2,4-dienoyl-CoA reductase/sulfur reductase-like enzyme
MLWNLEGQSEKKKVVVIGGGYIGMEVAAALTAWKIDTTVCVM